MKGGTARLMGALAQTGASTEDGDGDGVHGGLATQYSDF